MKPGRVRVLVLVGLVVACLPSLVDAAEFPNTPDYNFTGHTNSLRGVAVDSDGYVYSASSDGTVRKINPSGGQVWKFGQHTGSVRGVAVDSDGYVYSASSDSTVRKISPSGSQVWKFGQHTGGVRGVAVDEDGFVYSSTSDDTVRKINPSGGQVWKFTQHTRTVYDVAVDSDGYVYSASDDDTVRKINPSGGQVWSFTQHTGGVRGVAVDDDGFVYTASNDGTVRKINPSGGQVWSFTQHTGTVYDVAVDSDGFVYSASSDDTVRKISPSGSQVSSFSLDLGISVAVSSETSARYLAAGAYSGQSVYRWTEQLNSPPSVNVSTTPQQYGFGDDVDVSVDASDSNGNVTELCGEATRSNTTTTQTLNQSCRTTSSSSVTENFNGFFTVSDRGYNYTVNVNATDNAKATTTDSKTRTIGNTAFTDAFDVLGDNVGGFNVTIDGQTKSRGDQFITASSFNATFSKSGFFDKTATFTEGLNNEFTGVGDANVTVLVNDDPSNNTVSNYTATISNNSNGFSQSKNTTSGSVSFFAVQNATYNITADSETRPFTSRIVNVTSQQQNVTFSLKKERTAQLTFKDTNGNSLITQQVNYTFTPTNIDSPVVSGDTSTGSANETLLEPASYRGQAESNGFEPNTFFFTIRDESINEKTVYLTDENKTSPITVTVLDQATNPVSGVKVRLQRFYTNTSSYNTITASQTDSEGQTTLFPPADRAYYKLTFNRNNDLLKITDPLQLLKATYQFTVSLGETQLTESNAYTALSTDLRYDNATSDFKATIDQSGENNQACLITERTGALRTTRLNKTCTTSTTSTLILPRGQANDTYTATMTYQTQKSTFEVDTLTKSFGDETPATTTGLLGQLILTLVAVVPAVALLPSLSPVIIASTIALGWWIGLTTIGIGAVMAILVTGVTATIAARKR